MHMKKNGVLFARTNGGERLIREQIKKLTKYADEHAIRVVGKITMPHCSAIDYSVETHLTALIGRRKNIDDFTMILITDLSRISRQGPRHVLHLVRRLAEAGVIVMTPDLGVIDEYLVRCPLAMDFQPPHKGKKAIPHVTQANSLACVNAAPNRRGDRFVPDRSARSPYRNGPQAINAESRPSTSATS